MSSKDLFQRAQKVIPGGVSSPVRSFKHVGVSPVYFAKAEGARLFDVDGNSYIDFCLAFGPHLLGHSHPAIVSAVAKQVTQGTTFGACHPLEVELSEQILRAYSFLNKVRLVSSGTEAVMTAIRLARGATGRPKILKFDGCYHGHSDGLLARAGSGVAQHTESDSAGVPSSIVQETIIARYDDMASIKKAFSDNMGKIAAVIVEPIPANYGLWVPPYEHVKELVELTHKNGTLVIFDEVITGFRVGLAGATGWYDQRPDIVTLGKVIGGGLPLAALVGTEAVMNHLAPLGNVYQAGTLAGNALSCSAGLAAMSELWARRADWFKFEERCEAFVTELTPILAKFGPVEVSKLGSIFWPLYGEKKTNAAQFPPVISADAARMYAKLFTSALKEGIYLPPSPYEVSFLSFAHDAKVLDEALEKFKKCAAHA